MVKFSSIQESLAMSSLQLVRTVRLVSNKSQNVPSKAGFRAPVAKTNSIVKPTSLKKNNILQREYHIQPTLNSMRTRLRPDLVGSEPWKLGLAKGTPEFNEKLVKHTMWWSDLNTDKLAKQIEWDLDNGSGRVRSGIVEKLIVKAYKPEHLKVIHRALLWLQARWNTDMKAPFSVALGKAAYRARSPDMALRILNSPWMRILPNSNSTAPLLKVCAELAEEKLFASPTYKSYIPYPHENPVNDWKDPNAVEVVEDAPKKAYGRHAQAETKKEEVAEVEDFGGQDLAKSFANVVEYTWSSRHNFTIEPRLYAHQAEYYAAIGDVAKAEELVNKAKSMPPPPEPTFRKKNRPDVPIKNPPLETQAIMPTAYLASGDYKKAIETIKSSGADQSDIKIRRILIASYLALGEDQAAFELIKTYNNINTHELVQTHLGNKNRVEKLRSFYSQMAEEGKTIEPAFQEYLDKLDSLIPQVEEAAQEAAEEAK